MSPPATFPELTLSNGNNIPILGLGTWNVSENLLQ